jgi:hypothetical protein
MNRSVQTVSCTLFQIGITFNIQNQFTIRHLTLLSGTWIMVRNCFDICLIEQIGWITSFDETGTLQMQFLISKLPISLRKLTWWAMSVPVRLYHLVSTAQIEPQNPVSKKQRSNKGIQTTINNGEKSQHKKTRQYDHCVRNMFVTIQ